MYDLTGKVAIVTGAGGRHGIGRSIATRLASEGADVVVTDIVQSLEGIRPEDALEGWEGLPSVVKEIESMGRKSLGIYSDVSVQGDVNELINEVVEKFGKIDILELERDPTS